MRGTLSWKSLTPSLSSPNDSENKIEKAIKKIETAAVNNTDPTPYILEIQSIAQKIGIKINPMNQ